MKAYAKTTIISILLAVLSLWPAVGTAQADGLDVLRADGRLHNGLLVITIGRHIESTCPSIIRRDFAANAFLLGLATHAMSLGFSRAEVTRYVEDKDEQARYVALARQ